MEISVNESNIIFEAIESKNIDILTITPSTEVRVLEVVGVGHQGIQGEQGIQGPPGMDLAYIHNQLAPSDTWLITHNLDKFPSVSIVDSAGSLVIGDVDYININNITVIFTAAFGGKAYLN